MREISFAVGEHYHVYNRGVDQRIIFEFREHFMRFYENMYLFNDLNFDTNGVKRTVDRMARLSAFRAYEHTREPFVDIVAFILMPNHFHLHLIERVEGGISTFLHKLEMGYSKYYNGQNDRLGNLFNHPFQAKHVSREDYYQHLPRYIHLNALDMTPMDWRNGGISEQEWPMAMGFLDAWYWSSHHVNMGRRQLLPVVAHDVIDELFDSPKEYERFLRDWSGRFDI